MRAARAYPSVRAARAYPSSHTRLRQLADFPSLKVRSEEGCWIKLGIGQKKYFKTVKQQICNFL
ncbi:hypothetical protein [Capnocytophaga bilenii]